VYGEIEKERGGHKGTLSRGSWDSVHQMGSKKKKQEEGEILREKANSEAPVTETVTFSRRGIICM